MFDAVNFVIRAESGEIEHDEFVAGMQQMINSGVVWHLQGSWQRCAVDMIEAEECTR